MRKRRLIKSFFSFFKDASKGQGEINHYQAKYYDKNIGP